MRVAVRLGTASRGLGSFAKGRGKDVEGRSEFTTAGRAAGGSDVGRLRAVRDGKGVVEVEAEDGRETSPGADLDGCHRIRRKGILRCLVRRGRGSEGRVGGSPKQWFLHSSVSGSYRGERS